MFEWGARLSACWTRRVGPLTGLGEKRPGGLVRPPFSQRARPSVTAKRPRLQPSRHSCPRSLQSVEAGLFGQSGEQSPTKVAFENLRMDIASATDCRCISEMLRHSLHRRNDRAFTHGITVDMLELAERKRGQIGTRPGSNARRRVSPQSASQAPRLAVELSP